MQVTNIKIHTFVSTAIHPFAICVTLPFLHSFARPLYCIHFIHAMFAVITRLHGRRVSFGRTTFVEQFRRILLLFESNISKLMSHCRIHLQCKSYCLLNDYENKNARVSTSNALTCLHAHPHGQKMPSPGIEPGLTRPQRVVTTILRRRNCRRRA